MGGWYKLRDVDAHMLTAAMESFSDSRSHNKRMNMLLYCWSQMQDKGRPCAYFSVGLRTIAKECEVSFKSARCFIETLEEQGWIVDLGEDDARKNSYTKRTFSWIADEAGISLGVPQRVPQRVPLQGHTLGHTPAFHSQQIGAHRCALDLSVSAGRRGGSGTHQSTEYSEGRYAPPSSSAGGAARQDEWVPVYDPVDFFDPDDGPEGGGDGGEE